MMQLKLTARREYRYSSRGHCIGSQSDYRLNCTQILPITWVQVPLILMSHTGKREKGVCVWRGVAVCNSHLIWQTLLYWSIHKNWVAVWSTTAAYCNNLSSLGY